jgi:hypothetical protein
MEVHGLAGYVDMIVAERGQSEGIVLPRIVVIANSDRHSIKKMHDGSEDFLLRHPAATEILLDLRADARKRGSEGGHAGELRLISDLTIRIVIAILLAPPRVAPHCLQVAVVAWANPHFGPCRRNDQAADSFERRCVRNSSAIRIQILESSAYSLAHDSGLAVGNVTKTNALRRVSRLRGSRTETNQRSQCRSMRSLHNGLGSTW